jgi:DNA-binding GntR family transcriptional regulator
VPDARAAQRDHLAILVACKARSPVRAAKAMARHLTHTVDRVAAGLADADPDGQAPSIE